MAEVEHPAPGNLVGRVGDFIQDLSVHIDKLTFCENETVGIPDKYLISGKTDEGNTVYWFQAPDPGLVQEKVVRISGVVIQHRNGYRLKSTQLAEVLVIVLEVKEPLKQSPIIRFR